MPLADGKMLAIVSPDDGHGGTMAPVEKAAGQRHQTHALDAVAMSVEDLAPVGHADLKPIVVLQRKMNAGNE